MNIGICGSSGKIGSQIKDFLKKNKSSFYFYSGGFNLSKKSSSLEELFKNSDVVLDFSSPDLLDALLNMASIFDKTLIIGTTGFSSAQMNLMKNFATGVKIFYSSNFSIVFALITRFLCNSKFLLENFDIHIFDVHHKGKKDMPSGTSNNLKNKIKFSKYDVKSVSQSSARIAKYLAEHSVLLANEYESLKFTHKTLANEGVVKNVMLVVDWMRDKKKGIIYDMECFIKDFC